MAQLVNQENGAATESGGGYGEQPSTPAVNYGGAGSARQEHGASRKYGLLVPVLLLGDQADGEQVARRDRTTVSPADTAEMETEEEERPCTPPVCSHKEGGGGANISVIFLH